MLFVSSDRRRLQQRTFKNKEYSYKNSSLLFGKFGIQALSKGVLKVRELIPMKFFLSKIFKGIAKVWIRFLPEKPITQKPSEVRMGKGKGRFHTWIAPIKAGTVLFEFSNCNLTLELIKKIKIVLCKLSIRTKFITLGR